MLTSDNILKRYFRIYSRLGGSVGKGLNTHSIHTIQRIDIDRSSSSPPPRLNRKPQKHQTSKHKQRRRDPNRHIRLNPRIRRNNRRHKTRRPIKHSHQSIRCTPDRRGKELRCIRVKQTIDKILEESNRARKPQHGGVGRGACE